MKGIKHFALSLILAILVGGIGCSYLEDIREKVSGDSAGDESGSGQGDYPEAAGLENSGAVDSPRGLGNQGPGRGLGRRPGRGLGRRNLVAISQRERDAIGIEVVTADYRPLGTVQAAVGKVLAPKPSMAVVSYPFPARIAEIHSRIGDWVKPGQVLFTLNSEEVGKARTDYCTALADRELAVINLEREERLFSRGVGAQKNLQMARSELKVLDTIIEAAEKRLHVLGFSEEKVEEIAETHQISPIVTLPAPIEGKVIEQNALLGEMIDQSMELMTIMDPTVLCVDAEIYERDIAKIREGQPVRVSVPAYPDRAFTGKLCYISDLVDDETRTIKVRTEVQNRDFKLKPGMFASIEILLNQQERALVVPIEAVLDDGSGQIVFLEVDGEYLPQVVEVGTRQDGYYEIRQGVQAGDRVVTTGNFQLKSKFYEDVLGGAHVH